MVKGNFGGNWIDYWTLIVIGEVLTLRVNGYGTITVLVDHFKHEDGLQATWFEGFEQVDEGQDRKMPRDGKVFGVIYWNVDDSHLLCPAAPPIPVEVPKVILAPWIARESSQSL